MDMKKSKRLLLTLAALYWVFVIGIYLVASAQFHSTPISTQIYSPANPVGELVDGRTLTQRLTAPAEQLTSLDVYGSTFARQNTGYLNFRITNGKGHEIASSVVDISQFKHLDYTTVTLDQVIDAVPDEELMLTITSTGCSEGNAVTIFYGSSISTGKVEIPQAIAPEDLYTFSGDTGSGSLCIRINGLKAINFYQIYWLLTIGAFIALYLYFRRGYRKALSGEDSVVSAVCTLYCKYEFLLKQLVSRDFKTKYKRSVLGMAWSFLNPLLSMSVQYMVFSTLFKSNTPNYPVYLLSGVIFFNFFSEAVSQGMMSIVGNAALIKKVYMPKYIYPVSKLVSSCINFLLALMPLMLVMIATGTPFRPSLLLLAYDIACLLCFVLGMILLMSTAMTFFQDVQFLWGIAAMMWNYLTPIFYPETIIPARFLPIYRLNPMYQYITFARTCIIDGISPQPASYFWCLAMGLGVLGLGLWTFRRHQSKFVLYL